MFKMKAKFISSTNLGMEEIMPKDIYADISFGVVVRWYLDRVRCFRTSMIERFEWDKKTKRLKVFTLNSVYEFELEKATFRSNLIQCAAKEEIEHYRAINENELFEVVMTRVLTLDGTYEDGLYRLEPPLSFNDAKKVLVGQNYDRFGLKGKILHVYPPMQNNWL